MKRACFCERTANETFSTCTLRRDELFILFFFLKKFLESNSKVVFFVVVVVNLET